MLDNYVQNLKNQYIGKKYGSLTIVNIERNNKNRIMAVCDCECGIKDKRFYLQSMIYGKTKTCHTNTHKLCKLKKTYIGKRYGLLTIFDFEFKECRTGKNICHAKCNCDCGTKNYSCNFSLLKCGNLSSCGCLSHKKMEEHKDYNDLTGKKFGFWTVLYNTGRKNKAGYLYMCECSCKKHTRKEVVSTNLVNGHSTSCGCLQINGTNLISLKSRVSGTVNKNNSSGINGVYWNIGVKKWVAYITFQGKKMHLGCFPTKGEAYTARKDAEDKYYIPLLEKKYTIEEVKKMIKEERKKEIKSSKIIYSNKTSINTMDLEIASLLKELKDEE